MRRVTARLQAGIAALWSYGCLKAVRPERRAAGPKSEGGIRLLPTSSGDAQPERVDFSGLRIVAPERAAAARITGSPQPQTWIVMPQLSWFTEAHAASGSSIGFRTERQLQAEKTQFQNIEIYQTTDWGNLMVIDGCIMLTSRDNFLYHEMMSHPALFTHAAPRDRKSGV